MLLPAVLYVAAGSSLSAPAASFTPEGFLLVYGPLGILSGLGLDTLRRYIRSLVKAAQDAEERAVRAEARMAAAVQRESERADRAEARTEAMRGELSELNREVRHDVVPKMADVTRVMSDLLISTRTRS